LLLASLSTPRLKSIGSGGGTVEETEGPQVVGDDMQLDVIDRINRWLEGDDAAGADQTLHDARDEIVALRAMCKRERESASEAVRLMSENASRYGFLLGGLEMVVAGHTTADKVLQAAKARYGDASDQRHRTKERP
jgi:hypothetical protein